MHLRVLALPGELKMHPPAVERLVGQLLHQTLPPVLSSLPSEQPWKANSTTTFADEEPEALGGHPTCAPDRHAPLPAQLPRL